MPKSQQQPSVKITEVYVDKREKDYWLVSIVYETKKGSHWMTGPDGDNKILVHSQKELKGIVKTVEMLTGRLFIAKSAENEEVVRYHPME